uniref:Guanine nucleotide-binding protein alpha-6 subunit n=1 Tax=Parastrongyloides trichosuri TaxID=131310 RepID=A0A0N5A3Z3_PARTI
MGSSHSLVSGSKNNEKRNGLNSAKDKAMSAKEEAARIKENDRKFKILLLGGSECGKTTIFKQMRVLHLNGFSDGDRESYKQMILTNTVQCLGQLLDACKKYRISHETLMERHIEIFYIFKNEFLNHNSTKVPADIARTMKRIWYTQQVQAAYQKRWNFSLLDNAKYFLESIDRIFDTNYVPTTDDILHCRYPTTEINELNFRYRKVNFRMVDVGGQRSERRKWIHCFDNVNMVLFVVALNEFNQKDPEDEKYNRLLQNRSIFKTIVQSDFFRKAAIVLFFNKYDIFQEQIKYTSFKDSWKDYEGGTTLDEYTKYIKTSFQSCVPDSSKYYSYLTTATDTNNIDFVFASSVQHTVNQNLKAVGLRE